MNGWSLTLTGWPWWSVLALAALAAWTMVRYQRRELSHLPGAKRRALLALRGSALALIVLLLLEPTLSRTRSVSELPLVGILVDESGSMGLADRIAPATTQLEEAVALGLLPALVRPPATPDRQAASDAEALARVENDPALSPGLAKWRSLTRRERALLLVQNRAGEVFDGKARVRVFSFDEELRPLDHARPAAAAESRPTNFEAPLSELSRRWSRDHIGAVLLLSDGRQTAGQDPSPVLASLRARGASVSTIHLGNPRNPPDAAIAEVTGSHEAFRDEVIGFDVGFRVTEGGSSRWEVVVLQEGKEIQRRAVKPDGTWQTEHFETPARQPGTNLYSVRIEPAKGSDQAVAEATRVNNQSDFAVNVNQDPIRVFLADTTPRWESRFLSAMFERDRRVKFTRTYHSVLSKQSGGRFLPATQAEWDENDLIVLGDIDPRLFPAEQQQFCANYVARRGGFLVCVAGARGMPSGYNLGPLASILPVRPAGVEKADDAAVSLALTDQGRLHPITSVMRDGAFNERLWPALPPLQWIASGLVAKPGAVVLLQAQNRVRTPIVALQAYGAGRVLWMGTEESWRWRDRLGDRVHQTFWLQAMRWGLAARLRGQDARLQASLDRPLVSMGETAQFRARLAGPGGRAPGAPPQLLLEQMDAQGRPVPGSGRLAAMRPVPDSEGLYQADLSGLSEGSWRARVSSEDPDFANLSETRDFQVRARPGREFLELSSDPASMARLAEQGGGLSGGMAQADEIFKRIASGLKPKDRVETTTNSLWDNYLILGLILGLLIGEWVWRKRLGLP